MTVPRKIAIALLQAMVRHAPEESRDWAGAMLRELDFIESDWAALFWALGSTTAIFRQSSRRLLISEQRIIKEAVMKVFQGRAVGFFSGMAIALIALIAVLALVHFSADVFSLGSPDRLPKSVWVWIATLFEGGFIIAVLASWRKRRPMAIGMLLSAIAIGTHIVMHFSAH